MADRKDKETAAPASASPGKCGPAIKSAAAPALAEESFRVFDTPPEWSILIERGDFAPAAIRAGKDIARQIEDIAGMRPDPARRATSFRGCRARRLPPWTSLGGSLAGPKALAARTQAMRDRLLSGPAQGMRPPRPAAAPRARQRRSSRPTTAVRPARGRSGRSPQSDSFCRCSDRRRPRPAAGCA